MQAFETFIPKLVTLCTYLHYSKGKNNNGHDNIQR
jgi:hypothetical protein